MSRLELLPENRFASTVRELLNDIEDLKNRQILGGDSIKRYLTETGNTWDVTLAVPAGVATYTWRVTFTPDHPELHPYTEFKSYSSWSPVGTNQISSFVMDPANLNSPNTVVLADFFNLSGEATTFNRRFTFNSADTGSLSFVRIA